MTDLDALDHALLHALQDDVRQTNRDLAAAVHVSPSTSSERVRALRESGVIRGYHADIAPAALGRHVQAMTAVTIRPPSRENIEAFRDWASALPEIAGVFVVSGRRRLPAARRRARHRRPVRVRDRPPDRAARGRRRAARPSSTKHIRRTVLEPLIWETPSSVRMSCTASSTRPLTTIATKASHIAAS